jgi:transposase InsO family protein
MAWNGVMTVSELRVAFVHQVLCGDVPVARLCRRFGIARKTGYKWLDRYHRAPDLPLLDHPRRPKSSPLGTCLAIVQQVLDLRDRYHWGAAKIHVYLHKQGVEVPSARTVNNILRRNGRMSLPRPDEPPQRFERAGPNELWQLDFKGPLEVQRQRVHPLTIIDDHSRYLLALRPCTDMRFTTVWGVLWDLMGDVGMPQQMLCDNQFNGNCRSGHAGLSWFDARLLRLGIKPSHGRPYHPQTQGKVERLHGTLNREVLPFADCSSLSGLADDLERWRSEVYNFRRPHEALGMDSPSLHWSPSSRKRPAALPPLEYPHASVLRKIQGSGWISYRNCRILIGKGLAADYVRLEEDAGQLKIYYADCPIRCIAANQLNRDTVL